MVESPEANRAKIWVSGTVQGVGYRSFVQKTATSLGLNGYCKNLPDGRVEVEVEGDSILVKKLIENLRAGSSLSQVKNIEVLEHIKGPKFTEFSIRY